MASGSGDRAKQEESNSEIEEDATEKIVETAECPSCGQQFASDYCPNCGEKADSQVSIPGVIGGFFRELADVENGVWPTFVGLTLRPELVLRQYLEGARKRLAGPGRYLLLAVALSALLASWPLRLTHPAWSSLLIQADYYAGPKTLRLLRAALEAIRTQAFIVAGILISTGLFAHLLYRLFERQVGRFPEALAASAFLTGHVAVLERGGLVLIGGAYDLAGHGMSGTLGAVVSSTVVLGYAGWWAYRFASGWEAVGGVLAVGWVQVEATVLCGGAVGGYLLWKLDLLHAGAGLAVLGAAGTVPLLLHVGVETYSRWQ